MLSKVWNKPVAEDSNLPFLSFGWIEVLKVPPVSKWEMIKASTGLIPRLEASWTIVFVHGFLSNTGLVKTSAITGALCSSVLIALGLTIAFGVPVIGTTGVLVTTALGVPVTGAFKLTSSSFNGMTVGQVKAKYEKRWNEIASLYSDVSPDASVRSTEVRGSESEFPQFESDITAPPAYKSQSDAEIEAMPFVLSADEHSVKSLQEEFEALSSPLTKEDLEYLKATAHYQYSEGGAYRTPYVEPQVDLSGPGNSANRNLDTLDSDLYQLEPEQQRVILPGPESNTLDINTRTSDSNIQQNSIIAGVDNWTPTRSQNYLKRERSMDDGGVIQELHNSTSNTTFQRQVNQDGTISPVKATRNGNDLFAHPANGKADSPELTAVQHKATQALEREFWKPGKSKVDGAPDLTKSSKGEYGAFTDTADGREAVSILEADPDMEVTFTRLDENGDEEIVTMSSRDLLDYVKEQEEIAKDEIQAVKALASCALRFGSEAA